MVTEASNNRCGASDAAVRRRRRPVGGGFVSAGMRLTLPAGSRTRPQPDLADNRETGI
jgi:hypothetical protein